MGCSPDWYMTPEQVALEARRGECEKKLTALLKCPASHFTVEELAHLLFRPKESWQQRWSEDRMEAIEQLTGRLLK